MSSREELEQPVTFRADVYQALVRYITAGESCLVVGIGSVGKSNLLRSFLRTDIRQTYMGDAWRGYLFVYIDVNKMLQQSLWGFWELMLHQILIALTHQDADPGVLQAVEDLYRQTTEASTRYLALRHLDRTLAIIERRLGLQAVFLLDEFDNLYRSMPARGLAALRALRDDHKYRLSYIVATRFELTRLRQTTPDIEAFEELISPNIVWLNLYTEVDARFAIAKLSARYDVNLDDTLSKRLMAVTGGHPGLLRSSFQVIVDQPQISADDLALAPRVQDECRRIWQSLSAEEQQYLVHVAIGTSSNPSLVGMTERLRRKGMMGGVWAKPTEICSPVLAGYIKQFKPVVGARIVVDPKRQQVLVDGQPLQKLSRLEYLFIAHLDEKRGEVCSRDELIAALYPDETHLEAGVADDRLDSIVKRLRKQIEMKPDEPHHIVTVRGFGFRLVDKSLESSA